MQDKKKLGYCYLVKRTDELRGCDADRTLILCDYKPPVEYGRLEFMADEEDESPLLISAMGAVFEPVAREALKTVCEIAEKAQEQGKSLTVENLWPSLIEHFEPLYKNREGRLDL